MGSPAFAVPTLEALTRAHQVIGVITQPDRPAGRGSRLRPPEVKVAAERLGLPVYQPQGLRGSGALSPLEAWRPEIIVVAAFGQILSRELLALPALGCLNIHPSLLPRWRGASPISAAILAGDAVTGVTVMRMDEGVDSGPLLAQRQEPIRADDTTGSLGERLAHRGADLLLEVLPAYLSGALQPWPQPEEGVTFCRPLRKEGGRLDWSQMAVELERRVRAVTPWPGAFTFWRGQRLNVVRAAVEEGWQGNVPPGTVVPVPGGVAVSTSEGALRLLELQLAGRRVLPWADFVRGQPGFVGSVLG